MQIMYYFNEFKVMSQSSSLLVNHRQNSDANIHFIDIKLADSNTVSFDDVFIEVKSILTSQVERITVSYTSLRPNPSPAPQFNPGDQCPGPSCSKQETGSSHLYNILIILFTIIIIILLMLFCRPNRRQRRLAQAGVSPYGKKRLIDSRNAVDSSASTRFSLQRSDVSSSRRQSPVLPRH